MIKAEKALRIILNNINILTSEMINSTKALGRILAEDVYADISMPSFANSAMDGYAVRTIDLAGASKNEPKILTVATEMRAGCIVNKIVRQNQAIKIMTGAPLPQGADGIVKVEDTEKITKGRIKLFKEIQIGENIRKKGEYFKKHELLITKGTFLDYANIGLILSLGRKNIKVTRKPRVAILSTGDELTDLAKRLRPGIVYDINSYVLYNQVLNCGGIPIKLGIAKDNPEELENKIRAGRDGDLILISGGVSVGDYDLVKPILAKMGTKIKFWKIAMRPGKPLVFGILNNRPVFGLPGNPVSSLVNFEIFVKPALGKMLGIKSKDQSEMEATLEEDIVKKQGFRYFFRAYTRWEKRGYVTKSTGSQSSGNMRTTASANSLIILPEEVVEIKKGSRVKIRFLS